MESTSLPGHIQCTGAAAAVLNLQAPQALTQTVLLECFDPLSQGFPSSIPCLFVLRVLQHDVAPSFNCALN
jgi:hypothetical protein